MKQILPCLCQEIKRSRLAFVLTGINLFCALLALGLIGCGGYIKKEVEPYTNLVTDYDGDTMPYFLIAIGCLSAISNVVGFFVCYVVASPEKRQTLRWVLFAYLIVTCVSCVAALAGAIMCYTHISHLQESFQGGIIVAMEEYRSNGLKKAEVDRLQMNFECCGSKEYNDWFMVQWVPTRFMNNEEGESNSGGENIAAETHDNVPFSCCNPHSMRPCIHSQIHDNKAHYNYDYMNDLTISKKGCEESLMEYFGDKLLVGAGGFVIGVFLFQIVQILLLRYLQTSIFEALKKGSPDDDAIGYLCICGAEKEEAPISPAAGDDNGNTNNNLKKPLLHRKSTSRASKMYDQFQEALLHHEGDSDPEQEGESLRRASLSRTSYREPPSQRSLTRPSHSSMGGAVYRETGGAIPSYGAHDSNFYLPLADSRSSQLVQGGQMAQYGHMPQQGQMRSHSDVYEDLSHY